MSSTEYLGPTYVGPGAQYTYSTTRNVGTSWSVGAFLSIDSSDLAPVAAQLGIFASFTETTTVGDVSGSTQTCGEEGANGTFTCTMDIAPKCWKLRGTCEARYESDDLGRVPWAASFPQVEEGDEQAIYTANVCVCPNCPGADEEAAPGKCNVRGDLLGCSHLSVMRLLIRRPNTQNTSATWTARHATPRAKVDHDTLACDACEGS